MFDLIGKPLVTGSDYALIALIMKVFKNLFGRGDKIHVDEIAVAPGLLLGEAVIVESGTNVYGSWLRWGNGLQVCTATVTPDRNVKNTEQSFYFPQPFVEVLFARDSHAWGANAGYQKVCSSAIISFSTQAWRIAFTENTTVGATLDMYLFAIGWWK